MSLRLLSTKLHVPHARDNAVIRPRLIKKLIAGVNHPRSLILLSGPAGFGKTTLLGTFAAQFQQRVAWVSLDELDNDPIRFWTYLLTACKLIHDEIGASGLALLQSPQPMPDETLPTILINEVARLDTDLVIILDDYHIIESSTIHSALAFLLDHLPENLHLVISTRVDPPWPLARLRARDQLFEIRAVDLRFTVEETAAFLNEVMGLNLSVPAVAALEARTEGWIASLQLAAISMRERSDVQGFIEAFTGSHIYVAEYLMEEVLAHQPEGTKDFLLRTSLLERMTASLCEAVTGHPEGQAMLKEIYQSNLFLVPLDDEGQWFRYHQLFADLLKVRLSQTMSANDIAGLHKHATAWFAQNEYINEAVNHAFAAKDFDAAALLVDENAYQVMIRGELNTLVRWIEALPDDVLQLYPSILIKKAWALTLAGAIPKVEPLLQRAEAQISADDKSQPALELSGNAAAIRAFFAMMSGDHPRALELGKRAETLLPESNAHISWLVPFTLGSVHRAQGEYEKAVDAFTLQAQMAEKYGNLILWATGVTEVAIVRRLQGRLREAAQTCLDALQRIADQGAGRFGSLAKLEVPLIEVLCEQNELAEAQQRVTNVIARMQNWPMPTDHIFAYLAQIQVQEAMGELDSAFETLRSAKELKAKRPVLANLARSVDLSEIRLYLVSKETTTAARLLEALQPGTSPTASLREQELMMLARVYLAQHLVDEAEQILSSLAADAEAEGRNGTLVEILALLACTWQTKGDREKALAILIKALLAAEPEGFVRSFVDEGEAMRRLLTELSGILETATDEASVRIKDYIARLMAAFSQVSAAPTPRLSVEKESGLIDPLTSRELEVLQLIADGDSNQVIAEKLFITVSAVKKHTGNIFGKLSVNSRTQAVARARQLGLIV